MEITARDLRIGNYGEYKVREDGIIYSKKTNKPLKYTINDKGYPCVCLWVNNKSKFMRVHRVVAEVFLDNNENKPCVNHKDRNRANYHVDNLEWCTHSENVIHSVKNGGRKNWTRNNKGENNPNCKLSNQEIEMIRFLYPRFSQNNIATFFGLTQSRISKIVNFNAWNNTQTELTLTK